MFKTCRDTHHICKIKIFLKQQQQENEELETTHTYILHLKRST